MIKSAKFSFSKSVFPAASCRKLCTSVPTPDGERELIPEEEERRDHLTRIPRLIDNLPRYPLYQQMKDLRTKFGNFVDCSEIDKLEGEPVSEIEVFPLDRVIINNPILATDAPETRVDWPDEERELDMPYLPKIDLHYFETQMKQQLSLEGFAYEKTYLEFQEVLLDVESIGRTAESAAVKRVMLRWFDALKLEIEKALLAILQEYEKNTNPTELENDTVKFWTLVPTQKLTIIASHQVLAIVYNKQQVPLHQIGYSIAEAIRAEHAYCGMNKAEKKLYEKLHGSTTATCRKINMFFQRNNKPRFPDWDKTVKQTVGNKLTEIVSNVATFVKNFSSYNGKEVSVDADEAYCFHIDEKEGTRYLMVDDEFLDYLVDQLSISDDMIKHYPMLVPPRPWVNPMDGGYFLSQTCIIRYLSKDQTVPLFHRAEMMDQVYEALNALSLTPWRINKRVLEIIDTIWYLGGGMAEVPRRMDHPMPEAPGENATEEELKAHVKACKRVQKENIELASLRGAFYLKMDTAFAMKDHERFYYPYNMDFRGRVYPIPPHLNHIGSDLGRGLLTFADGRPLGSRGFYWLHIQLANLCGQDKTSHAERANYVRNHLMDFIDTADYPLTGSREWMKKENPWQYMACCIEFVAALRSGNPEEYVCSLPIQQDGTCNGLQHYAALGGDIGGAMSVNVLPSDYPQDVYSEVLKAVLELVQADIDAGHETALLVDGKIKRAIVKQTIMTSVYGVTFVGARAQIENAMRDKYPDFPQAKIHEATSYIAKKTFEGLAAMFGGARKIMDWLNVSARLVCKGGNELLWITPLGMPVQQPYRRPEKNDEINTLLRAVLLKHDDELPLNPRRNATAFPPNFVHSLDSSHMMLTANECYRRGIQYASVHDSYWTLPCYVDEMNEILREKFVELYKQPILPMLREFWLTNDPYLELPPLPDTGKGFDINMVKESKYFFH